MMRASFSILLAFWLCRIPMPVLAADPHGLIKDKRQVSTDPLDGIPEEDPTQKGTSKPHGEKNRCRLLASPVDDHDVADLRSTVVVIQRAPKSVPCPGDLSPLRLRISIDAKGRVSSVERLSGDKRLGDSLVRVLTGQLCESAVTTSTRGVAQIQLKR
jgi:hypothetical protein